MSRPSAYFVAFGAGDRVVDKSDPRHEGRVNAVFYSTTIRVRWDNGWQSDVDARHLTLVSRCPARAAEAAIDAELQSRSGGATGA